MEDIPLQVRITRTGKNVTVNVSGEVDLATAPQLDMALSEALAGGGTRLLLDFHGVTFLDSEGMKALVKAHRRLNERGGKIAIVGCRRSVGRLFDLLGLATAFGIKDRARDDWRRPSA